MKLYMAPLQSYTTSFYRKAHVATYSKMDKYFTPFFEVDHKSSEIPSGHPELSKALNDSLRVVPQIATNNGSFLADFAKQMKNLGFNEINLNAGCPFPMLVKRQRGGGLLSDPDLMKQMLDEFYEADTGITLSVKMRLGQTEYAEGETITKLLNHYPLKELIIHPRLVTQKYSGEVDWDQFERLQNMSQHALIANGDINTPENAASLTKRFSQIKGLMLGRGLLSNPSLHLQIKEIDTARELIFKLHQYYFNLITSFYNDWNQIFNHLQTFWYYPLQKSLSLKRHYRRLKKHNKPDSYREWLKKLEITY